LCFDIWLAVAQLWSLGVAVHVMQWNKLPTLRTLQSVISSMNIIRSFTFIIATAVVATAAPQQAVDPDTIKDKVSITLGQEFYVKFKLEGNQLLQPSKYKRTEDSKARVKIKLDVTTHSPIRPPREGVTRPYLVVENDFERTLSFRALARFRGSKEFFEIDEGLEAIFPGERRNKCWGFASLVEEVVLYQFTLSPKPSK